MSLPIKENSNQAKGGASQNMRGESNIDLDEAV